MQCAGQGHGPGPGAWSWEAVGLKPGPAREPPWDQGSRVPLPPNATAGVMSDSPLWERAGLFLPSLVPGVSVPNSSWSFPRRVGERRTLTLA